MEAGHLAGQERGHERGRCVEWPQQPGPTRSSSTSSWACRVRHQDHPPWTDTANYFQGRHRDHPSGSHGEQHQRHRPWTSPTPRERHRLQARRPRKQEKARDPAARSAPWRRTSSTLWPGGRVQGRGSRAGGGGHPDRAEAGANEARNGKWSWQPPSTSLRRSWTTSRSSTKHGWRPRATPRRATKRSSTSATASRRSWPESGPSWPRWTNTTRMSRGLRPRRPGRRSWAALGSHEPSPTARSSAGSALRT